MAPKAKAKGKARAKSKGKKGKGGGREVIKDRKMDDPKDLRTQAQIAEYEKLLMIRAVKKMQRYCRGVRVEAAMEAIHLLEDLILTAPTHGAEAIQLILKGPKKETPLDGARGSGRGSGSGSGSGSEVSAEEEVSRSDSQAGSHPGSQPGSRPFTGSKDSHPGSKLDSQPGSKRGSKIGSQMGSRAGSKQRASLGDLLGTPQPGSKRSSKDMLGELPVLPVNSAGSASSGSSSESEDSDMEPHLTEHTLSHAFKHWGVEDHHRQASLIFWIMGFRGNAMFAEDIERIYRHHRIRRRNQNSKVHLYLVLMLHGDAKQSLSTRPTTVGPLPSDGPRPLDPEGWEQVTRIAWALRLCPKWSPPGLVLTANTQCCLETTERLRVVSQGAHEHDHHGHHHHNHHDRPSSHDRHGRQGSKENHHHARPSSHDRHARPGSKENHHHARPSSKDHHHDRHHHQDNPQDSNHHGHNKDHHHHNHHHHHHHDEHERRFPHATVCDPLNFPRSPEFMFGPVSFYVAETLTALMLKRENPSADAKKQPGAPPPCLIVAGGAVLETLIACLTCSRPREEALVARLRGGDAVLLSSSTMCGLVGDDEDERWRPNSNMWSEALKRDDWSIVHHLRGSGEGQPKELGGIPEEKPEQAAHFKTRLTAQWNRYAGRALILTDDQYFDIRKRAGFPQESGMGFTQELGSALRPLTQGYTVREYVPPEIEEEEDEDDEQ